MTNTVGTSLIEIENVLESVDLGQLLNLFMKYVEFKNHIGTLQWNYLMDKDG